ncbi:MAG TPA: RHS repeat domain-containing protein, partial [Gemmatimonadaceae bacterium]|nr:RHS repeat domain-containing protein [Gemmatimonadaceae bacterium]
YDAGNRPTQVDDSVGGTITRQYDLSDRLTSETTPEGTISYTYDALDRMSSPCPVREAIAGA